VVLPDKERGRREDPGGLWGCDSEVW